MKQYQSHKIVEAFKIADLVYANNQGDEYILTGSPSSGDQVVVSSKYYTKHNPQVGGYYVKYPDGYESWSPADSFEEGYTHYARASDLHETVDDAAPHSSPIYVIFDGPPGPPGPESGRFVEVEDAAGRSINAGNWIERNDGHWALRLHMLQVAPTVEAPTVEAPNLYADDVQFAAVLDILQERSVQDAKWGGPDHDSLHISYDFLGFIKDKIEKCEHAISNGDTQGTMRRTVQIAALALANIERLYRQRSEIYGTDKKPPLLPDRLIVPGEFKISDYTPPRAITVQELVDTLVGMATAELGKQKEHNTAEWDAVLSSKVLAHEPAIGDTVVKHGHILELQELSLHESDTGAELHVHYREAIKDEPIDPGPE